jgi:hypothetical protein
MLELIDISIKFGLILRNNITEVPFSVTKLLHATVILCCIKIFLML